MNSEPYSYPQSQPPGNKMLWLLLGLGCGLLVLMWGVSRQPVQRGTTASSQVKRSSDISLSSGLRLASQGELDAVDDAFLPYYGQAVLPDGVDLSADLPPAGQQGRQGSCVGWTTAYALKSLQEKQELGFGSFVSSGGIDSRRIFSPAFVYNQINQGQDEGARIIDALNLLQQRGVATWESMPYQDDDYLAQPDAQTLSTAQAYRIESWRDLPLTEPVIELKSQLSEGFPVVAGVRADSALLHLKAGEVWHYLETEPLLQYHALLIVGYDDHKQAFKLFNSWGPHWGEQGFGWMAYASVKHLVREAYVSKDARTTLKDSVPVEPSQTVEIDFYIHSVMHRIPADVIRDAAIPLSSDMGLVMQLQGRLEVPPGYSGEQMQVLVRFYETDDMGQKRKRILQTDSRYRAFTLPNGEVVAVAPTEQLPQQGSVLEWKAYIPYNALEQQAAVFDVLVEPMLYIDDFGVKSGNDYAFTIHRE